MKNSNWLAYGIIILMSVSNLYLVFKQKGVHLQIKKTELGFQTEYEILKQNIRNNSLIQFKSNSTKLEDNIILITKDEKLVTFNEINNKTPLLVLRTSETHCNDCILKEITNLKDYSDKNLNICVVSYFDNIRDFYLVLKEYNIGIPIFTLQNNSLGTYADSLNIPYYFIIDSNNIINSVFVPDEGLPEMTVDYLESIKNIIKHEDT